MSGPSWEDAAKEMGYDGYSTRENHDGGTHVTFWNDVGRASFDYDKDGNYVETLDNGLPSYHETLNDGWHEV